MADRKVILVARTLPEGTATARRWADVLPEVGTARVLTPHQSTLRWDGLYPAVVYVAPRAELAPYYRQVVCALRVLLRRRGEELVLWYLPEDVTQPPLKRTIEEVLAGSRPDGTPIL